MLTTELADSSMNEETLLNLVQEYLDRTRAGTPPDVEAICARHPGLALRVRELFPTLAMLEELGPVASENLDEDDRAADLPDRVGDYRIIGEIGRGGMGTVYEAEQESLSRRVALKILPHSMPSSANARLRFQREARAAARMHHTNIVPVFEVGQDGDRLFYAMQLIQGQGLDRIMDELRQSEDGVHAYRIHWQSPDPQQQATAETELLNQTDTNTAAGLAAGRHFFQKAAGIALQVANALEYAHARGVIHRDVKPSNVMLDVAGVVWVMDFGLAKNTDEDATLTATGDFLGTLRYMSPERFRGQCNHLADVYSIGLTLYELVLHRPAFDASDRMKLIYQINNTEPAKPRSINPRLPRDLETIILKAIEKEPARRYASAGELAHDLQRFIDDEPVLARRTSLREQAFRWARRNRSFAAAMAGIAVLLVAMIVVLVVKNRYEKDLRLQAQGNANAARSARKEADSLRKEAETALNTARTAFDSSDQSRKKEIAARQSAVAARQLAEDKGKELRQVLYSTQINLAAQGLGTSSSMQQMFDVVRRWDPKNQHGNETVDLRGWEWFYLRSIEMEPIVGFPEFSFMDVAFSPDDSLIAFTHSNGPTSQHAVSIVDIQTGKRVGVLDGHAAPVIGIDWNRRRNLIATFAADKTVRIWDPVTRRSLHRIAIGKSNYPSALAWSDSGEQLAVFCNGPQREVLVYQTNSLTAPPMSLVYQGTPLRGVEFSPDETCLAGTGSDSVIWDLKTGKQIGFYSDVSAVAWQADSNQLEALLVRRDSGDIQLFEGGSGLHMRTFRGMTRLANSVRFTRDGLHVIAGGSDNTVRIWNAKTGKLLRTFQRHIGGVRIVEENNSGDRIFSWGREGYVWNKQPQYKTTLDCPLPLDLQWLPGSQHLMSAGVGQVRTWNIDKGYVVKARPRRGACSRVSPDGRWLAYALGPRMPDAKWSGVEIIDRKDSRIVAQLPTRGTIHNISWHPTRPLCLYAGPGDIQFYNVQEKRAVKDILQGQELSNNPWSAAWNPRRPELFAYSEGNDIKVRNVDTKQNVCVLAGHWQRPFKLEWSPDGERLASVSGDGTARIWTLDSTSARQVLSGHNNAVNGLSWSPDGTRLATCGTDGTVRIWDTAHGTETLTLPEHAAKVSTVAWSPDGNRIAAGGLSGKIIVWDANAAYAQEKSLPAIAEKPPRHTHVQVSEPALPVGELLLSPDWTWSEPENLGPLVNTRYEESEPCLSNDGLTLLFHSNRPGGQGGLDLWMTVRKTVNSDWQQAKSLGPTINTPIDEMSPYLSDDGLTLYFSSDLQGASQYIWSSTRKSVEAAWSIPTRLSDRINSRHSDIEPAISADGRTMLFTSMRQPRAGVYDLWMSRRETSNLTWSDPVHLASEINCDAWQGSPSLSGEVWGSVLVYHTESNIRFSVRPDPNAAFETSQELDPTGNLYDSYAPFLSQDGKELYFRKSERQTGSKDLWVSRRVRKTR